MLRMLMLILCLLPAVAFARDWQVDAARSTLTFQGSYQGEVFEGRFKSFQATIAYDPADLAQAKFDVSIDLASVDTASAERDDTLKAGDFFAIDRFPTAHFVTESFAQAPDGSVTAHGKLTLRGHTQPVTLKVTFTPRGDDATLDVATSLERSAFGLGTDSDWNDISADIAVHGHLLLHAR